MLVLANAGRGLATLALVLAPGWPALVAIVAPRAAVDAFFGPAKQAALQALVPPDGLVAASGLSQAVNQATKVAAPAVGAGLLLPFEPQGVFAANAALSALAALVAAGLPPIGPGPTNAAVPLVRGLRDAVDVVRRAPALRGAVLLAIAGTFAVIAYDTQVAPRVRAVGQCEEALGLFLAAIGVGGVGGGLALARIAERVPSFGSVAGASLLAAVQVGALGLAELLGRRPSLPSLLALGLAIGVASAFARAPLRAVIQRETPSGMMGRVAALTEAAEVATLLVAPFLGAARFSVGAAFVAGAALALIVAGAALHLSRRAG